MTWFEWFLFGLVVVAIVDRGVCGVRAMLKSWCCAKAGNMMDAKFFRSKALRHGRAMLIAWAALCLLGYSIYVSRAMPMTATPQQVKER